LVFIWLDCWIYCSVYLSWIWYVYFYLSERWQIQALLSHHYLIRNFEDDLSLFSEVNETLQYLKNEIAKKSERCYIHLLFSKLTLKRPRFKIEPNYTDFLMRHWILHGGFRPWSICSNWCPLYSAQSRLSAGLRTEDWAESWVTMKWCSMSRFNFKLYTLYVNTGVYHTNNCMPPLVRLLRDTTTIYGKSHAEHINTMCEKISEFSLLKLVVIH